MKKLQHPILILILAILTPVGAATFNSAVPGWCATFLPDFQLYKSPKRAEDIQLLATDGSVFRLSDLKGHLVLLNFWKKDCPYCVQEKAFLRQVAQSIASPDLKIVCANLWDSPDWVKSYGRNVGPELIIAASPPGVRPVVENVVRGRFMGYFVLNDSKKAVYEVKGFPSSYVINREGFVVASHLGMAKWSSSPIKNWLQMMLSGSIERASYPDGTDTIERLLLLNRSFNLIQGELSSAPGGQTSR